MFDFAIAHVPVKPLYTGDSLSRSPKECNAHESKLWNDLHNEVEGYVNAVLVTLPASDQRLDGIRSELKNDDTLKTVKQYVQNGPEEKRRVHKCKDYSHSVVALSRRREKTANNQSVFT